MPVKDFKKVSIIIPTYNGGVLFKSVLDNVFNQDLRPDEVIVIDSSSTDGTEKIAKDYPVRFVKIKQTEFGHGKTRNYGAKLAKGEYVVFLTQDAVPRNIFWLKNLVEPLKSKKIAGSFSRQIARDEAVPMEKFFYSKMYPDSSKIITQGDIKSQNILFSNASSAIQRSFILKHPFAENILMSEDLAWALQMLREGYKIDYKADSQVTHSHDTSLKMLFKRYFDFGVSHNEIAWGPSYFGKGFATFLQENIYLVTHGKMSWIPRSLSYNFAKFLGLFIGKHNIILPRNLKQRFTTYYKGYWT